MFRSESTSFQWSAQACPRRMPVAATSRMSTATRTSAERAVQARHGLRPALVLAPGPDVRRHSTRELGIRDGFGQLVATPLAGEPARPKKRRSDRADGRLPAPFGLEGAKVLLDLVRREARDLTQADRVPDGASPLSLVSPCRVRAEILPAVLLPALDRFVDCGPLTPLRRRSDDGCDLLTLGHEARGSSDGFSLSAMEARALVPDLSGGVAPEKDAQLPDAWSDLACCPALGTPQLWGLLLGPDERRAVSTGQYNV